MSKESPGAPADEARPGRIAAFWQENQPAVLIAAPDEESPAGLVSVCRGRGIRTLLVHSGSAALITYGRSSPDAVVIGEGLLDVGAQEVASAIEADGRIPVLLVRAGEEPNEDPGQVTDIYPSYEKVLSSPVLEELLERSHTGWPSDRELVYGPLVLRPSAFEVRDSGVPVLLTLREFELLRVLMLAQGRAVTVEKLKSDVWGAVNESVRTETVKVHMNRLRHKLTGPVRPAAVRGVGYLLKSH